MDEKRHASQLKRETCWRHNQGWIAVQISTSAAECINAGLHSMEGTHSGVASSYLCFVHRELPGGRTIRDVTVTPKIHEPETMLAREHVGGASLLRREITRLPFFMATFFAFHTLKREYSWDDYTSHSHSCIGNFPMCVCACAIRIGLKPIFLDIDRYSDCLHSTRVYTISLDFYRVRTYKILCDALEYIAGDHTLYSV